MSKAPKISLIAALSDNRVIGFQNRLPWSIPEDLKRFREITSGHPVIMGRKTYESIGRVLPHRLNVIITRNPDYSVPGAETAASMDQAIEKASKASGAGEIFVIGGAEIYAQALPRADRLYLTQVHARIEGDAYFPEWDEAEFKQLSREDRQAPMPFSFRVLERI